MTGYDYGNARLRALKSQLLQRNDVEIFATLRSLDDLINALTKTVYRPAVEAAIVYISGMNIIAEALRLDVIARLGSIRRFYSGREHDMLAIMLRRFDVHNLKTMLRGLASDSSPDDIQMTLIPIGELTEATLSELIRTAEPRAAIDLLASMRLPIARPLLDLRAKQPGASTAQMELALDRWYFAEARAQSRDETLNTALNIQADMMNVLTALRFAHAPEERQLLNRWVHSDDLHDLFVEPGSLSLDALVRAASQDTVADAIALLPEAGYGVALRTGLESYQQSKRLSDIEKPLKHWHLRWSAALVYKDPLGMGVPLAYIALKISEVNNIRWIAQAINLRLDSRAIQQELEFVA